MSYDYITTMYERRIESMIAEAMNHYDISKARAYQEALSAFKELISEENK